MLDFLAQAGPRTGFGYGPGGLQASAPFLLGMLVLGFVLVFLLLQAPVKARRIAIVTLTFVAGLYYAMIWLWPSPINLEANQIPANNVEHVGKWLKDNTPVFQSIDQTLRGMLLGLGVWSVLSIHGMRLLRKQKDWAFSAILLLSAAIMVFVTYSDYNQVIANPNLTNPDQWGPMQYAKDFLFDGMLQSMDAAMFSIIAFFILSAAYRAFRIRSIEATILLASALIVMLALMGGVEYLNWQWMQGLTGGDPGHFLNNFSLTSISGWIRDNVRGPGIRALEFGVGIGALTMGLRLWLSLEKTGS